MHCYLRLHCPRTQMQQRTGWHACRNLWKRMLQSDGGHVAGPQVRGTRCRNTLPAFTLTLSYMYVAPLKTRYQRTELRAHLAPLHTTWLDRHFRPHRPPASCCALTLLLCSCAPRHPASLHNICSSTCISSPLFNDHVQSPLQISRVSVLWKHTPHLARAGSHHNPRLLISLITFHPKLCQRRPLRPPPRHPCRFSSTALLKHGFSSFHHSRTLVLCLK